MKSLIAVLAFAGITVSTTLAHAQWDPCQGRINGTWGYKGGRSMTLDVDRTGGGRVRVIVSQANGAESTAGTCRADYNGNARLVFRGQFNNGDVTVYNNGYVRGVVSGYSFEGRQY